VSVHGEKRVRWPLRVLAASRTSGRIPACVIIHTRVQTITLTHTHTHSLSLYLSLQEHAIEVAPVPLWKRHLNQVEAMSDAWRVEAAERRQLEPYGHRRAQPEEPPTAAAAPPEEAQHAAAAVDDDCEANAPPAPRKPAALPWAKRLQWVWMRSSARAVAVALWVVVWDGGAYRCGKRNVTVRA
jgi:hypothetical protein